MNIADKDIPTWLLDARNTHWDVFLKHGLPTRKDERWKYTDLTFVETSLRGDVIARSVLCDKAIQTTTLPNGVIFSNIHYATKHYAEFIKPYLTNIDAKKNQVFAHLNTAMMTDGFFVYVPDNTKVEMPIRLLSLANETQAFVSHPHHIIVLGKNSQLTVLEEYQSETNEAYFNNVVSTIHVGENSHYQHYKLQRENISAAHIANTFLTQEKDSQVTMVNFSLGGAFSRDDVMVNLQASGANCQTTGFYRLLQDNQYIDHHISIEHVAPHTQSSMLYKGILDKKSRAVFNGRLHVTPDANKMTAFQENHHLLLSNQAEAYSKPELEIYADDVKCKHGATTGQLDQDALFYFRSRGIDEQEAVQILLRAFANEIFQKINDANIRSYIENAVNQ